MMKAATAPVIEPSDIYLVTGTNDNHDGTAEYGGRPVHGEQPAEESGHPPSPFEFKEY